ncbi:MAG: peptidylprolyl isomerase [Thermoanaerobaculia bacterium]
MLKALWWWLVPDVDVIPDAEDTRERLTRLYRHQVAELYTTRGVVVIRFYPDAAPEHVMAFARLAGGHFYDGTTFNHVIAGTAVEGGDLDSLVDPSKRSKRTSPDSVTPEYSAISATRGIVSALDPANPHAAFCGC